jgi:ATP-dependent metalloprotease FtsH
MFTDCAQTVIDLAKDYASSDGPIPLLGSSPQLALQHLLAALAQRPETRTRLADALGLSVAELKERCPVLKERMLIAGRLPLADDVRALLTEAKALAEVVPERRHPGLVGPDHLAGAVALSAAACAELGVAPRPREAVLALLAAWQDLAVQTPRLDELTDRLRTLREAVQARLFGQDHAVKAFVEGLFNSELVAAADTRRPAPRASFVFAGPPGVGKTLLAELAAAGLERPFKRFDMSAYADHQQFQSLVGWARSYKEAHPGVLTEFVEKHPDAVLLFDEIEKAHLNTVQLFFQILDAGVLEDQYHERNVAFRDTIAIFTTNAGRKLYDRPNASGVQAAHAAFHRQTILDALASDLDPRTGQPFFPAALCSRLAKGYPVLFDHLGVNELERVVRVELEQVAGLLERQYAKRIEFDEAVALCLVLREGARADARTLCAQAERFVKAELFQFCQLFETERLAEVFARVDAVRFVLEADGTAEDPALRRLFTPDERPVVLLVADPDTVARYRQHLSEVDWRGADSAEAVWPVLAGAPPVLALVELGLEDTSPKGTIMQFDRLPAAARGLERGQERLRALHQRLPELPVWLLVEQADSAEAPASVDPERFAACVRGGGARGVLVSQFTEAAGADWERRRDAFAAELRALCRRLYREREAARLGQQRQVLSFVTAPRLERDGRELVVRLRQLRLSRALAAADAGEVLEEVERPQARLTDVIGAEAAKEELQFFIEYLKEPRRYAALGLKPPKGVLLYGPPGTGKTLLARALAGESEVAFIPATASAFVTLWQGSGPQAVRDLFARARRYAPAIVFIDEIDAIGKVRTGGVSGHAEENTLNALLTELDGFTSPAPDRPVFVLAATNFGIQAEDAEAPERSARTLDPALVRRFSRAIRVDLPDTGARRRYLEARLADPERHAVSPSALELVAEKTVGMSLADLEMVLETAARLALRQNRRIDDDLLIEAIDTAREGEAKPWSPEFLESTARHEAGHTLMYWLSGWWPVEVSIVARAERGGGMRRSETELKRESLTRAELLASIRTALGGRAAELVYYGPEAGLTTGASSDLDYATRLARQMICRYGMDEDFGPLAAPELLKLAEAVGSPLYVQVTETARGMLKRELEHTVKLLEAHRPHLDAVAAALMAKNRLLRRDLEALLPAAPAAR